MYVRLFVIIAASIVNIILVLFYETETEKFQLINNKNADSWEYLSVGINYFESNEYPMMGLNNNSSRIIFDEIVTVDKSNILFCVFSSNTNVLLIHKPPFYSLIISDLFFIFSPSVLVIIYFNLVCLALGFTFLNIISHKLFGVTGFFISIISNVLALNFLDNLIYLISPDLFLFFILVFTMFFLTHLNVSSKKMALLAGLLLSITLLTKGTLIVFIVFTTIYLLFNFVKKGCFSNIVLFFLSFSFPVILWSFYINTQALENKQQFYDWKEGLPTICSNCIKYFDKKKIPIDMTNQTLCSLVQNQYVRYASYNFPIVVSNQLVGDEILSVHNELSSSGNWIIDWRYIDSLFYNMNKSNHKPIIQIAKFYWEKPKFIYLNAFGKLKNASKDEGILFFYAILLLGFYSIWTTSGYNVVLGVGFLILSIANMIFEITPIFLFAFFVFVGSLILENIFIRKHVSPSFVKYIYINSLTILIIFYGDPRFTNFLLPISLFLTLILYSEVVKKLIFKVNRLI